MVIIDAPNVHASNIGADVSNAMKNLDVNVIPIRDTNIKIDTGSIKVDPGKINVDPNIKTVIDPSVPKSGVVAVDAVPELGNVQKALSEGSVIPGDPRAASGQVTNPSRSTVTTEITNSAATFDPQVGKDLPTTSKQQIGDVAQQLDDEAFLSSKENGVQTTEQVATKMEKAKQFLADHWKAVVALSIIIGVTAKAASDLSQKNGAQLTITNIADSSGLLTFAKPFDANVQVSAPGIGFSSKDSVSISGTKCIPPVIGTYPIKQVISNTEIVITGLSQKITTPSAGGVLTLLTTYETQLSNNVNQMSQAAGNVVGGVVGGVAKGTTGGIASGLDASFGTSWRLILVVILFVIFLVIFVNLFKVGKHIGREIDDTLNFD